jgi:hypothetical protein
MIEAIGGGVLGTLLGGVFRLAPEFLKWMDRKDERKHELSMFDRQVDLEKTRGDIKLQEIGAQREAAIDTGAMAAFQTALKQQTEMTKAAGGWAATISALVRPLLTYYLLLMYGFYKAALVITSPEGAWHELLNVYNPEDMALLAGVVNYWMIDRTLRTRGLS